MPHGTLQTLPKPKGEVGSPSSNDCIIFKRTFETKFGQESLKIGRFPEPHGARLSGKVSARLPAGIAQGWFVSTRTALPLAAAHGHRYIDGGFPLNRAVNSPCAAGVRIKARQAGTEKRPVP
jgi:hypothetical protein